jgi:hypothetical protein
MCYEFLPYALLRAKRLNQKTFLEGIQVKASGKYDGGSESWAAFLCDTTSQGRVAPDKLATLQVVPGDVIVMYGGSRDAFHTVIVSGTTSTGPASEGPMVYTLADRSPTDDPAEMTLSKIIEQFLPYDTVSVGAFTVKPALLE